MAFMPFMMVMLVRTMFTMVMIVARVVRVALCTRVGSSHVGPPVLAVFTFPRGQGQAPPDDPPVAHLHPIQASSDAMPTQHAQYRACSHQVVSPSRRSSRCLSVMPAPWPMRSYWFLLNLAWS
jgi:hypothetical protein